MKRKIIQIANSTQLISLPRKWAIKNGIKKGDEMEVQEHAHGLLISTDKIEAEPSRFELDISGMGRWSKRVIGALYRAGYDEISIKFSNSEEFKYIQDIMQNGCIGFEMIEQGKKYAVVKRVSSALDDEFEPIFKRSFMFLLSMSKESLDAITSKDKEHMNNVTLMDRTVNKFIDFCGRILNKRNFEKAPPFYHILQEIEHIADEYKDICTLCRDNDVTINKSIVSTYKKANQALALLYDMIYKFDLEKMKHRYKLSEEIYQDCQEILKKNKDENVQKVAYHLLNISKIIFELDMAIMEYKL